MWSDNETSEDFLGFKVHADLLIDVIKDDSVLPVTIGVFGDWGSGKSSILKIVKEELSDKDDNLKDGILVLYFNGWTFEGYDDAKAALLESIIDKFDKHKTLHEKVKHNVVKLFKSVNWMRVLGLGFKKVVIPGAAAYLTGGLSLIPYLISEFSKMDAANLAQKLKSDEAEDFLKDIIKKNADDDITLVRDFRNDFKEMIDKSEIEKLVVIIDDLDRCTPDRIIENLEAIKLFLNVEKTAFLIGADPRIVRHAIEHRYKTDSIESSSDPNSQNRRIVSDYLEKLIQVPYMLPRLSDSEVETYMTLLFCKKELKDGFKNVYDTFHNYRSGNRYGAFGIGDLKSVIKDADEYKKLSESVSLIASLSSIITEGLNGNPRQIKRFLNTFTLRNRLVNVAKIQDFKVEILAKLMVLEYSSPSLFKKIYEWQVSQKGIPKELSELERQAQSGDIEEIKNKYTAEWASEKIIRWLSVDPKLHSVDLRDYYWISRDQLFSSISGSSLIPTHIKILFKTLVESLSATILSKTITREVLGKLSEMERDALFSLLENELMKSPENANAHKVFIEMISQKYDAALQTYLQLIPKIDNSKIPFSLRNELAQAEKDNSQVELVYKAFNKNSNIYNAINSKK